MPRPKKKESVPISFRLDKKIHEELEEFCQKTGMSKTIVTERALLLYISRHQNVYQRMDEENCQLDGAQK